MVSDEACPSDDTSICELERAEMILKEKRRNKRKLKNNCDKNVNGIKRRRIIRMDSDSDSG